MRGQLIPATVTHGPSLMLRDMVSTPTTTSATLCTPYVLPSNGVIDLGSQLITLTENVLFTPECGPTAAPTVIYESADAAQPITGLKDPFYASVTIQVYATGAATVIAWMLVFMLLITPRTFFVGGAGGGFGLLGRRGMISGARGGASVIGVGSRPWLQKVAALTVAISMTIATADTFKVAEQQYLTGYMDAEKLRSEVVNSTEIKVSRIVSDVFLWLALVQTLIRLFPRHREKVLIKWIGFALIILDVVFMCLNSFTGNPVGRPKEYADAIPALSYLFQLALSMLYAAWVIYYAIRKRKYSFYHSYMWNVSFVALLSLIAILTPVIFFITDISDADIAGWGDYFRWVGAAAASVIVWEWVERIEALEREEKKDGILGREIFDGDELVEVTGPSDNGNGGGPRNRRKGLFGRRRGGGDDDDEEGHPEPGSQDLEARYEDVERDGQNETNLLAIARRNLQARLAQGGDGARDALGPNGRTSVTIPPPSAVSPISRTDTASATSTVYTIRYHTINTPTTPLARTNLEPIQTANTSTPTLPENPPPNPIPLSKTEDIEAHVEDYDSSDDASKPDLPDEEQPTRPTASHRWHNPFKRKRALPPAEVRAGQIIRPVPISTAPANTPQPVHNYGKWDLKGRLGAFAAEQGEKWLERKNAGNDENDLPVTIIPAQPRGGRTWTPQREKDAGSDVAGAAAASGFLSGGLGRVQSPDNEDDGYVDVDAAEETGETATPAVLPHPNPSPIQSTPRSPRTSPLARTTLSKPGSPPVDRMPGSPPVNRTQSPS